jgi:hypothetical protein
MLQGARKNGDMNLHMRRPQPEYEVAALKTVQNRLVLNLRKLVTSFSWRGLIQILEYEIDTNGRL